MTYENDQATKTAIYKLPQASKQACAKLHYSPPLLVQTIKIILNRPMSQNLKYSQIIFCIMPSRV